MSLINDALKKAQRQRTDAPAAGSPSSTGGTASGPRIAKRGPVQSANTMVLLGSAALVLVVLSVVATVFLVNRPTKPAAPAPKVETTAPSSSATVTVPVSVTPAVEPGPATPGDSTPIISVPLGPTPSSSKPVTPPPTAPSAPPVVVATAPTPTPAPVAPPSDATNLPAVATPAVSPAEKAQLDERVAAFIEGIRVTGIRSFGNESRVLMNERVFRVNDIVERTLGVRLKEVKVDSLIFTDPSGKTYVKNF